MRVYKTSSTIKDNTIHNNTAKTSDNINDDNHNNNYHHYLSIWNSNLFPMLEKLSVKENITMHNINYQ